MKEYNLLLSEKEMRDKLREEFLKNKQVTDIRAIDLLVIKVNVFGCLQNI